MDGDEKGGIPAGAGYEDATEEGAFEVTAPREAPTPGTVGAASSHSRQDAAPTAGVPGDSLSVPK